MSHNEARDLLSPFGAIAKVEDLDPATQERLGLSPAVRVRFERFDPRRDVIRVSIQLLPLSLLQS